MGKQYKRIFIAAGGTGGHVMPGLAVAAQLRDAGYEIIWLGTAEGIENRLVSTAKFQFQSIRFHGIRKKGWRAWATLPFHLLDAMLQSLWLMCRFKPQLVLGFGGYVAAPVGIAAWLCRCPLILHDQNRIADSFFQLNNLRLHERLLFFGFLILGIFREVPQASRMLKARSNVAHAITLQLLEFLL